MKLEAQQVVGLNESLVPHHQQGRVVMVALIVDPNNRCLVMNGSLPMQDHVSIGECSSLGPLPFLQRLVTSELCLNLKRMHQVGQVYTPYDQAQPGAPRYFVYRVDVTEGRGVPGGEWVSSAERAWALGQDGPFVMACAQLFMGELLTWQRANVIN